jgi:hypothetical protein
MQNGDHQIAVLLFSYQETPKGCLKGQTNFIGNKSKPMLDADKRRFFFFESVHLRLKVISDKVYCMSSLREWQARKASY